MGPRHEPLPDLGSAAPPPGPPARLDGADEPHLEPPHPRGRPRLPRRGDRRHRDSGRPRPPRHRRRGSAPGNGRLAQVGLRGAVGAHAQIVPESPVAARRLLDAHTDAGHRHAHGLRSAGQRPLRRRPGARGPAAGHRSRHPQPDAAPPPARPGRRSAPRASRSRPGHDPPPELPGAVLDHVGQRPGGQRWRRRYRQRIRSGGHRHLIRFLGRALPHRRAGHAQPRHRAAGRVEPRTPGTAHPCRGRAQGGRDLGGRRPHLRGGQRGPGHDRATELRGRRHAHGPGYRLPRAAPADLRRGTDPPASARTDRPSRGPRRLVLPHPRLEHRRRVHLGGPDQARDHPQRQPRGPRGPGAGARRRHAGLDAQLARQRGVDRR